MPTLLSPVHRLQKRSISLYGHRTSIALEEEFWQVLAYMAQKEGRPLASFIAQLDTHRPPEQALASMLRLTALRFALTHPPLDLTQKTS